MDWLTPIKTSDVDILVGCNDYTVDVLDLLYYKLWLIVKFIFKPKVELIDDVIQRVVVLGDYSLIGNRPLNNELIFPKKIKYNTISLHVPTLENVPYFGMYIATDRLRINQTIIHPSIKSLKIYIADECIVKITKPIFKNKFMKLWFLPFSKKIKKYKRKTLKKIGKFVKKISSCDLCHKIIIVIKLKGHVDKKQYVKDLPIGYVVYQ